MTNIVIVSHGRLAEALVEAAEMIAGAQDRLKAVSILPGESPEALEGRLSAALHASPGQEALVLLDLLGGTPCNVALRCLRDAPHLEAVTGVSLPMLLELLTSPPDAPAAELARLAAQAGRDAVRNVRPMLQKG